MPRRLNAVARGCTLLDAAATRSSAVTSFVRKYPRYRSIALSIGIAPLLRYHYHLRCRLRYYYFRLLQELHRARARHAREIASSPFAVKQAAFATRI